MAKGSNQALTSDFSDVLALLQERGLVSKNPSQDLVQVAKTIHGITYSFILWRFRLNRLPLHGMVFIEEIASDAIQILPQVIMGYSKTAKLLMRGITENALRHIYFSDHPVEFARVNREGKWYLSNEQLIDYAKNHPDFIVTESKFNAISQISSLYSELSAGVHGRAVKDLEMRVALEKIAYDPTSAAKDVELLKKCAQAVNFLLAIFQRKKMKTFQLEDRRIFLKTMPKQARAAWSDHETE